MTNFYITFDPIDIHDEVYVPEQDGERCCGDDCDCQAEPTVDLDDAIDCVAHDFEEWAGDSLLTVHEALRSAVAAGDPVWRVRHIVHAIEHLEDVLDALYPDDDDDAVA